MRDPNRSWALEDQERRDGFLDRWRRYVLDALIETTTKMLDSGLDPEIPRRLAEIVRSRAERVAGSA